jgi:hypothetical protein
MNGCQWSEAEFDTAFKSCAAGAIVSKRHDELSFGIRPLAVLTEVADDWRAMNHRHRMWSIRFWLDEAAHTRPTGSK